MKWDMRQRIKEPNDCGIRCTYKHVLYVVEIYMDIFLGQFVIFMVNREQVDPYLDITNVYNHLQHKKNGRSISKQIKSLSTICGEVLGFSLSKVCFVN